MAREHYPLYEADLKRGEVERNGPFVSLTYCTVGPYQGRYMISRSPEHPAGAKIRFSRTLRMARMVSSTLRNEGKAK